MLEKIQQNPNLYPETKPPYRAAVMKDFPYLILYEIKPKTIVINSVFHTKQDPSKQ